MNEDIRLLIIDDDSMICKILKSVLGSKNLVVDAVQDGSTGLDMVKKGNYKIVLLDISLPDINGLDLLKDIMELKPETSVIIISGYISPVTLDKAMALGAKNYVTKPFEGQSLMNAIKNEL